jgi:hypothetical protein
MKLEIPSETLDTNVIFMRLIAQKELKNKLRGFSPQSKLYRQSDRRLSAKLIPTLADRGCRVISAMNPHGR